MYQYRKMNRADAMEICYQWKYDGIYSFYDMTEDEEDLAEFLKSENWSRYFSVILNEALIGFLMYNIVDDNVFIGLGIKPDHTGKGSGQRFIESGLVFFQTLPALKDRSIRLCVAEFNTRAIKVYKRIGFKVYEHYIQHTNGAEYPFVRMLLERSSKEG